MGLLICLAVVGSRGQPAAQKILTPPKEDDPRGKTHLEFLHESSSSSEEKPQEGLNHCIISFINLVAIHRYVINGDAVAKREQRTVQVSNHPTQERMESLSASQQVLLFLCPSKQRPPCPRCCSGSVYCNYPFCSCVQPQIKNR